MGVSPSAPGMGLGRVSCPFPGKKLKLLFAFEMADFGEISESITRVVRFR